MIMSYLFFSTQPLAQAVKGPQTLSTVHIPHLTPEKAKPTGSQRPVVEALKKQNLTEFFNAPQQITSRFHNSPLMGKLLRAGDFYVGVNKNEHVVFGRGDKNQRLPQYFWVTDSCSDTLNASIVKRLPFIDASDSIILSIYMYSPFRMELYKYNPNRDLFDHSNLLWQSSSNSIVQSSELRDQASIISVLEFIETHSSN